MIYLDTHVASWLYDGRQELFPPSVRRLMARESLMISPIVGLELQYLHETGRLAHQAEIILEALKNLGIALCPLPFEQIVEVALAQQWTRDPFDRIIVSQARLRDSILVTKDRLIRRHYSKARWG